MLKVLKQNVKRVKSVKLFHSQVVLFKTIHMEASVYEKDKGGARGGY